MMKYLPQLKELLALEYNCSKADFDSEESLLTVSALKEGRRVYSSEKYFFHMVTLGKNAVVTADEALHPFLSDFIKNRTGHWLFEIPNLLPLEKELNRFGYTLSQTHHMFLPCRDVTPEKDFSVKWFHGEEIWQFYGDERFPNAICSEFLPHRPDRTVVCAYDGDEIIGMAGCSEDAPNWMQIGIDVMPKYRSKGIGTYLVTVLKNRIEENGNIPFYGTSVSNYRSWNIALNCGFRPAWVEIGANKIKDDNCHK
ncbi:MAG: GNAT family N-acetyltransferase [Ruminococcaceae bacterium]|nr:GNAT family N-acetyltransferase [Oscillospiraceae bacterium]